MSNNKNRLSELEGQLNLITANRAWLTNQEADIKREMDYLNSQVEADLGEFELTQEQKAHRDASCMDCG